ncbi:MAG: electron transport complex subunit RsxC [Clostridiales bacterium]|nr:electron transport complex subunit RsxC [Clostridiales bacterium]
MKKPTFKKGIHPPHSKHSEESALVECPTPDTVYIPLSQHIGKPASPCVAVGDKVKAGTLIGKAEGLGANIFSSVSGTVKAIERRKTPTGACDHVVIENDGKYETEYLPELKDNSKESIISRLAEAGLVGMGGAGFPSHVKYSPKKTVDVFIINAAECEPYITCDYRLLVEHTKEVLKGAALLAKALGLDAFYVGIEDNKQKAVEIIERTAGELSLKVTVVVLKSKYPQGAEKQLIYAVTGRKVPVGGLPADVGVVVGNVHTAFAAYDAVENNTPLFRRALTVCGGGIVEPKNLWVRTGTLYSDCEKFCGGAKDDCVKTISGGPMMGFALPDTNYSVTKTTGAILFLGKEEANTLMPGPCINCATCRKVCPMNLMPMYIDAYALCGDFASAKRYGAMNCIECGCCAYSCPAKRPIVQSVRLAKRMIKEKGL